MTRRDPLAPLAFLAGPWTGAGAFDLEFTAPRGGLLFGSLRVYGADGRVSHWEAFRAFERDGDVFLNVVKQGLDLGDYRLVECAAARLVFEHPGQTRERRLVFESDAPGVTLEAAAEGEVDGRAYRPTWTMTRPS